LMVVIVIVAILAAVAVPLYINYVKDARRTEAKAAIGALATAMEEFYLKTSTYEMASDGSDLFKTNADGVRNSNLSEETLKEISGDKGHWTVSIAPTGTDNYTITLSGKASGYQDVGVVYTYKRGEGAKFQDTDGG